MKTARANIIGAIVCALFGIIVWVLTDLTIRGDGTSVFSIDARLFPHFIACMIVIISLGWCAHSIVQYRYAKNEAGGAGVKREPVEWSAHIRVVLAIVLFFAYAQAVKPIGFLFSSLLAAEAALLVLREKRPVIYIVVACCVVFIYVLFQYFLKVRLP